jgi:DUF4097 and DUF4098 domain-containing protein YvlB
MITSLFLGALSAAALIQQTDTIVAANGATGLEVELLRGEVVVRTWDRNEVRIQATHPESRYLEIDRSGETISLELETERGLGLSGTVSFDLTVPRAFDLNVEGMAVSVDIEGTEGQVDVTTIHGPIHVRGGRGAIDLESVNGEIIVEGAEGTLDVTGVAGGVSILDCSGEISAESVGGSLTMEGIRSRDVEAGTVGGTLRYDGSIESGGRYTFGSHGGEIWLFLPPGMDARLDATSLVGRIDVDYPGAPAEATRPERGIPGLRETELSFTSGQGGARIEVETFGGRILIRARGAEL